MSCLAPRSGDYRSPVYRKKKENLCRFTLSDRMAGRCESYRPSFDDWRCRRQWQFTTVCDFIYSSYHLRERRLAPRCAEAPSGTFGPKGWCAIRDKWERRSMTELTPSSEETSTVTPLQAIIILVALVPLVGCLVVLGQMIGVAEFLFAGFLFVLYWTGIKRMASQEFAPGLVGSLGGLGLAYLIHTLPAHLGFFGGVLAGAALALSIYLLIRGQASMLINYAFMLLLTVATSVAFKDDSHYAAAAASILLAGAYTGALALIGKTISSRSSKAQGRTTG